MFGEVIVPIRSMVLPVLVIFPVPVHNLRRSMNSTFAFDDFLFSYVLFICCFNSSNCHFICQIELRTLKLRLTLHPWNAVGYRTDMHASICPCIIINVYIYYFLWNTYINKLLYRTHCLNSLQVRIVQANIHIVYVFTCLVCVTKTSITYHSLQKLLTTWYRW